MTTDIDELYSMVNSFMRILGEEPFARTNEDTDKKELKSLMDRYVSRLRSREPKFAGIPDELIPDALLQPLRAAYAKMP
ncbi:MAG: hypothetical protein KF791_14185 [Verrucomicrobiae bacterium]|nr:hypothetical protein [Verrucomicrobiae bacterium]